MRRSSRRPRIALVVALLPMVVAGALGCSKRAPAEPRQTTVDEAEFHMTLPGGFTETKGPGEYTFASAARKETLSVSTLAIPGEDPRGVLDQLVEARRAGIVRATPSATLTAPTYEEAAGTLRARLAATDAAGGTFTSCLFLATKTRALTVVFYEYGGADGPAAAQRADAIFATFAAK